MSSCNLAVEVLEPRTNAGQEDGAALLVCAHAELHIEEFPYVAQRAHCVGGQGTQAHLYGQDDVTRGREGGKQRRHHTH